MIKSDPTNNSEQALRKKKLSSGRKQGALGLSVNRLDNWPERFKGIVRYGIVAVETLGETTRRCHQQACAMHEAIPTMSAADWARFAESDPALHRP